MAGSPQFPKTRGADVEQSRVQDNIAGQVAPVARAVAAPPMLHGTVPQWISFSLLVTGTLANNTTSPLLPAAGYYLDPFRRLWVQGSLVSAAGCAAATVFTTLPKGLRPRYQQRLPVKGTGGTFQSILFDPGGNVSVEVAVAAGGFVDLSGSFLADG